MCIRDRTKKIQLEAQDNGYLETVSEEGVNPNKTLLKSRPGRLQKINAGGKNSQLSNHSAESNQVLVNLKSVKLTEDETKFIKEYRRLEDLEREKGIKFFQCVGDPPHTQDFVEGVEAKRHHMIETKNNEMRERDCTRFTTVINSDRVVVDTTAP